MLDYSNECGSRQRSQAEDTQVNIASERLADRKERSTKSVLTIRQEQLEALRQCHLRKFEDEMVLHLQEFSPRHWRVMGEADGRRVIRLGVQQAAKYGFTNHGPVRFHIELMFMFGSYFDTDPQCPWASQILKDHRRVDQMVLADRLFTSMNRYLMEVSGPQHEYLTQSMQRLNEARADNFVKLDVDLESGLSDGLATIYPQKHRYLGDAVVRSLIRQSFNLAKDFHFSSDKGRILMAVLSFSVGHRFPEDPLYGWIASRLNDPRRADPNDRIEELYSKSRLYLRRVLENLG
jgi:hypothetical protein